MTKDNLYAAFVSKPPKQHNGKTENKLNFILTCDGLINHNLAQLTNMLFKLK